MVGPEKFIALVKKRSFIYDTADPNYRNLEMKKEAWNQIAKMMGIGSSQEWRLKWKNLRDCYTRYRRNVETAKEGGTMPNPWPWSEQMSFLDIPIVQGKRKKTDKKIYSRDGTFNEINEENSQSMVENPDECLSVHKVQQQDSSSESRKRKRKNSPVPNTAKYPKMEMMDNNETNTADVDHLFLSYAKTFKKFPRKMQSKLKLKMATLFDQFEMQHDRTTC